MAPCPHTTCVKSAMSDSSPLHFLPQKGQRAWFLALAILFLAPVAARLRRLVRAAGAGRQLGFT